MKRPMFSVLTAIVLAGLTGCIAHHRPRAAACVGGDCAAAPEGCCATTQHGGQSCADPSDDGAVPAKKHCCPLLGRLGRRQPAEAAEQPVAEAGPPGGAITYPYYTNRGPRDFLAKNPQSIGP